MYICICNSLLSGASKVVTDVLQNVQNAAARLLLGYSRRQSGLQKAMRENLHWLRITDRINYKLCLVVYKALHGQAPEYLQQLCIPASSDIHRTRLRSAHIWNSLPQKLKDSSLSLNVFKTKDTFYLWVAFNCTCWTCMHWQRCHIIIINRRKGPTRAGTAQLYHWLTDVVVHSTDSSSWNRSVNRWVTLSSSISYRCHCCDVMVLA